MARQPFGGDIAGYTIAAGTDGTATLVGGAVVTFWSAQTGGSQHADLRTGPTGSVVASSVVSSDGTDGTALGQIPLFMGPDEVYSMWASANNGPRVLMVSNSLAPVAASVTTLQGQMSGHLAAVNPHGVRLADLSGVDTASLEGAVAGDVPTMNATGTWVAAAGGAGGSGGFIPTIEKAAASGVASLNASSLVVQLPAGRGVANGVASLDAGTKIPAAQIPDLSATYVPNAHKGLANGVASLNASGLVIQNPATSYLPTSQKAAASGVPSLDASSRVVQDPASRGLANGVASLDASTKVPVAQIPDLSATYVPTSQKAAASGVASLDAGTKIPVAQIPDLSATYLPTSQKAAASGVASLDAGTKIPAAQIPDLSATYVPNAHKGLANGVASLNASGLVIQNPATSYLPTSQKAAASGVASLGTDGKVPAAQLPAGALTINVKDYGATGDGATDDSAAITNAVAALPSTGGTLYFPRGTYMCRFVVTRNNCRVLGDGPGTVIKKNSNGTLIDTGSVSRFTAESVFLDGNGATFTGDGLSIGGIHHRLVDMEVKDTAGYCVTFPAGGAGHSGMVSDSIFAPYNAQLGQANEAQCAFFLPDDNAVGQAPNRAFVNLHFNATQGFNDAGSENTKWVNCTMRNFVTSGQPRKFLMSNCRVASSGAAISVNAFQSCISASAFAGDVTLAGNQLQFVGNVLGNLTLAAGLIDSKVIGNSVNTAITDSSATNAGNQIIGSDLDGYQTWRVATDSTTAYQWKNSTGGTLLVVNTFNGRVGLGTNNTTSVVQTGGAIATPVVTNTAATYTLAQSDSVLLVNVAVCAVTLPSASGITGRRYTIKKITSAAGNTTVGTTSSQTIDGSATQVISAQNGRIEVISDGTNWQIVT